MVHVWYIQHNLVTLFQIQSCFKIVTRSSWQPCHFCMAFVVLLVSQSIRSVCRIPPCSLCVHLVCSTICHLGKCLFARHLFLEKPDTNCLAFPGSPITTHNHMPHQRMQQPLPYNSGLTPKLRRKSKKIC